MKSKVVVVFPSGTRNKGKRKKKSRLRELAQRLKKVESGAVKGGRRH